MPLYDTLGPEAASYIIAQSDISLVVCDNAEKLETLLAEKDKLTSLSTVVMIDEGQATDELKARALQKGVDLVSYRYTYNRLDSFSLYK